MKLTDEIQSIIDSKKRSGDFHGLSLYLTQILTEMPDECYFFAELSSACYQLEEYDKALTYAHEAYKSAPDDYWVRYIYGCALLANDEFENAAAMFDSIISCDVNHIAYYEHGEGKRWAESLLNDSRYMRAVVFQQKGCNSEARDMFLYHRNNRKRGLYSDFSIGQVNKHIKTLDLIIGDRRKQ